MNQITLFCSGREYYSYFVEISTFCRNIHVLWILSAFCGIIHVPWILPGFCGYYPNFMDMIRIFHITSYLARNVRHVIHSFVLVVNIIYIGHITSYLARNVCPILHIYSSSESYWCINYFPVCNLIFFSVPSSFHLVCFVREYKLNPNPIQIYVPYFYHFNKSQFIFCLFS